MLRIPVSLDDAEIITAHFDEYAAFGLKMKDVLGFKGVVETWRCEMEVNYYPDDDVLLIIKSGDGRSGGTLRDDFGVIFTFEDVGNENITRVDIHDVSHLLPLDADRGYDADTDILTMGDKPDADYRVVDNDDFVGYWQECDGGRYWDIVAVDLRRASEHLAPVIAELPQPASASTG